MCDIKTLTTFKTKTVYKVVYKSSERYITPLTNMVLTIGTVAKMKFAQNFISVLSLPYLTLCDSSSSCLLVPSNQYYNTHMIGRTSGFNSLEIARRYKNSFYDNAYMTILKIKLGGSIYSGTGKGIMDSKMVDKAIVYAGSEVLSIKEVQ